jgi:hypothetical protein
MYSSKVLNSIKRNYITTKREALDMVYALHKFRHYLLGNMFTFFVDHMALIYLINKPQVSDRLTKWLLLFLEYNFKIVYRLGRSHLMANALSRLPNHTKLVGIPYQTYDAHMFTLQPEWLQSVYEYLLEGVMLKRCTTSQRQYLAQRAKPFVLQEGVLYRFGQDNTFRRVLQLE